MNLPDFIVAGAAKSGTTALFNFLTRHPQIFIPEIKECRFFSGMPTNFKGGQAADFQNRGPRTLDQYLKLYERKEDFRRGDISNDYFYYYKSSITSILSTYRENKIENPRIVLVLRNPVDRVFSMYHHIIRLASDTKSFIDAFKLSKTRIQRGFAWMFDLQGVGMSYEATKAYLNAFKNIKIYLIEDICKPFFSSDLFCFLDVNSDIKIDTSEKYNVNSYRYPSAPHLNYILHSIIRYINAINYFLPQYRYPRMKNLAKTAFNFYNFKMFPNRSIMDIKTRKLLTRYYERDIKALSGLIGRNLDHWVRF